MGWLPGPAGALVFLGLLIGLGWPWWLSLALGLAAFAAGSLLTPRAPAAVSADRQDMVKVAVEEARDKLRVLEGHQRTVDAATQELLRKLIAAANRILKEVEEKPQALGQVRSFFNYYLDAAVRIVSGSAELAASGLKDEATVLSLTKATQMLGVLEVAFEKQMAALMRDDVMDLNTEMELLERTMESEGWKKP